MNLIYLSLANLKDRLFINEFVNNFKWQTPTLIFHENFGKTPQDSIFVTKRISALMSECMVHNQAFSAAQRDFYAFEKDTLTLSKPKIEKLLSPIPLLILSPVVKKMGVEIPVSGIEMVKVAKEAFENEYITLFSDNPLSPLGNAKNLISDEAAYENLLKLYEEEKSAITTAFALRPAKICTPRNYSL